ncbi:hypothetical protein QVD17_11861 [Tagetes erecta]|uniref:Uncharacterized protein n=1 Tax=Tagetes erecta TaxID=13708 RepID=A0AAD8P2F5_TARER|nr:hypothetical protein QVD17_11861 [Tagetes erecta]
MWYLRSVLIIYVPQAETANVVPVLCVARNVACNVGVLYRMAIQVYVLMADGMNGLEVAHRLNHQDARNINDFKSERSQLLVPTAKPSLLGPIQGPEILNKQRAGYHLLSHGTPSSFYT